MTPDTTKVPRLVETERWVAWVRLGGLVFAVFEVGLFSYDYPRGYEAAAWTITGLFGVGSAALFVLARRADPQLAPVLSAAALLFDTLIVCSYAVVYSYEYGSPTRWALIGRRVLRGRHGGRHRTRFSGLSVTNDPRG